jgi:hypothetical protein
MLLAAALLPASPAAADGPPRPPPAEAPSEATRAQAREAFRVGSALAHQEVWVEALGSFERSQRLLPHPVTVYNIGFCERALGHATRARKMFKKALADANAPGAQPMSPDIAASARGYDAEIERRLARVNVTFPTASASLAVDGRPLEVDDARAGEGARPTLVAGTRDPGPGERPPASSFVLLLDPGVHVFVISAQGVEHVVSKTFSGGSSVDLTLRTTDEPDQGEQGRGTRKLWTTLAFGIGAAGIAVGSFAGVGAAKQKSALDAECGPTKKQCSAPFQGAIDDLHTQAAVSTAGFVVGGVGIAAGTVLLVTLLAGSKPARTPTARAAPSRVRVEPIVGSRYIGLRGEFL